MGPVYNKPALIFICYSVPLHEEFIKGEDLLKWCIYKTSRTFKTCRVELIEINIEYFSVSQLAGGTDCESPSSWKTKMRLSHTVNTLAADNPGTYQIYCILISTICWLVHPTTFKALHQFFKSLGFDFIMRGNWVLPTDIYDLPWLYRIISLKNIPAMSKIKDVCILKCRSLSCLCFIVEKRTQKCGKYTLN